MQSCPTHDSLAPAPDRAAQSLQHAERAYQGLTVAAVLLLLASLCLFW
jgi:hypothetical protein